MDENFNIFYVNGNFLVFDGEANLKLKDQRLVVQMLGCTPKATTLPALVNHYVAKLCLDKNWASFKRLRPIGDISNEQYATMMAVKLGALKAKVERQFRLDRIAELKKRGIEVTESRIGTIDEHKLKLDVQMIPDPDLPNYETIPMSRSEVQNALVLDERMLAVYNDLYNKGLYIGPGLKFGSDFLIYPGDPRKFHAQYAIRIVDNCDSFIDLAKISYREVNCLTRLCYTANKTPVLAAVYQDCDMTTQVKYWTMKSKEYLNDDSDSHDFEPIDPRFDDTHDSARKIRR